MAKLQRQRAAKGLSRNELASLTRPSYGTAGQLENGLPLIKAERCSRPKEVGNG
jgi:transcriptional regulator with XRE-family HTH domain